ncbi:MAG: trimethylamine methyltransferase family protein [Candidatus Aerophobetes bacterium]|nr:trimethylamine methyltransferase family protein [Candidatus Aerophobetes bacterium]
MLKGFTRKFKPLEILTEEQVEAIHRGTLEILENTGMTFYHEKALKLFEKNGCKVDFEKKRAYFPPALVEECLRKCPSSFHVKARDPKSDLIIGGDTLYFTTFPGMRTVDLDTWESRVPTKKENDDAVKVLDALDNLHKILCYTPYFEVKSIPPITAIPESVAAKIRNSTKIQLTGYSKDCEIFNIKMAISAGTEIFGQCCASPPLTYYGDAIESAFRFIEAGFPLHISTGDVFGGTAPATLAGSMITNNAEIIAIIVLTQLIKPGTRVVAADFVFPQNMQTGSPAFGAIGCSLHHVMFNQIWRKYGIPTNNASVGVSSSKKIDFQCGYERAILALLSALSGGNIIQLHGGIHGELTYHPIQSILDDDIAGMIGRFIEGVEVSDETLAIDLIEEVGPIPGFYLNKEHTRKWWKKEQFVPKAADRLTYPEWMKKGKKSCLDYAKEKMDEILATHKPIPLTEDQDNEIERILEEARKYYQERGML